MSPGVILLAEVGGTHTSTPEAALFWILGTVAVLGAIGVVAAPKAVYSAVFLACTMIALAVLYIAQDALFLGVVQVVVYTGAVMMLFLFVLMLIGVDLSESFTETLRGQRLAALGAGTGFGILLIAGIGSVSVHGFTGLTQANSGGNVEGLAALIFTRYLWAFELTSTLLHHRRPGRDGAGAPGTLRAPQDPTRAVRRAIPGRRASDPAPQPRCLRAAQRRRRPSPAARWLRLGDVGQRHPAATHHEQLGERGRVNESR